MPHLLKKIFSNGSIKSQFEKKNGCSFSFFTIAPKWFIASHLTLPIRIFLAFSMSLPRAHGEVTRLAKEFDVSRTTLYNLAAKLPAEWDAPQSEADRLFLIIDNILRQRMTGKTPLQGISELMKHYLPESACSSVGFISETLKEIGQLLPSQMPSIDAPRLELIWNCDEIFARSTPILITVDPRSSLILSIQLTTSRTAEEWQAHWKALRDAGHLVSGIVIDQGSGLQKGAEETFQTWINDLYHGVAHQLGIHVKSLERKTETLLAKLLKLEERFFNSEKETPIRTSKLIKQIDETEAGLRTLDEMLESFRYIYSNLVNAFDFFDGQGNFREVETARKDVEACLELLNSEITGVDVKKEIKSIRQVLPGILNSWGQAKKVYHKLRSKYNGEVLQVCVKLWQAKKKLTNRKDTDAKRRWRKRVAVLEKEAKEYLEIAGLGEEVMEGIFWELDGIGKSSSMVECINSILRPYLSSMKGQVSQEFLNLFLHWHNHRRYEAGKRKGSTPWELWSGKKQEHDWTEVIWLKLENAWHEKEKESESGDSFSEREAEEPLFKEAA